MQKSDNLNSYKMMFSSENNDKDYYYPYAEH